MFMKVILPTDFKDIKIRNLFQNGELFGPTSPTDSFWLGCYYMSDGGNGHIIDPILMNFHFTSASEQGLISATLGLAHYYYHAGYQELGIAYYKEAVKYGDILSAHHLGWHYYQKGNFKKMKKYYIIAIEDKYVNSMNDLGWYYYEQKKFIKMKKYYLMGCDNGFERSFNNLELYYNESNRPFGLLKLYIKYHEVYNKRKQLIDKFNVIACQQLSSKQELKFLEIISNFVFNSDDKLCSSLKLLNSVVKNKFDLIDLHFKYSVRGKGAIDAKKDFLERCI